MAFNSPLAHSLNQLRVLGQSLYLTVSSLRDPENGKTWPLLARNLWTSGSAWTTTGQRRDCDLGNVEVSQKNGKGLRKASTGVQLLRRKRTQVIQGTLIFWGCSPRCKALIIIRSFIIYLSPTFFLFPSWAYHLPCKPQELGHEKPARSLTPAGDRTCGQEDTKEETRQGGQRHAVCTKPSLFRLADGCSTRESCQVRLQSIKSVEYGSEVQQAEPLVRESWLHKSLPVSG